MRIPVPSTRTNRTHGGSRESSKPGRFHRGSSRPPDRCRSGPAHTRSRWENLRPRGTPQSCRRRSRSRPRSSMHGRTRSSGRDSGRSCPPPPTRSSSRDARCSLPPGAEDRPRCRGSTHRRARGRDSGRRDRRRANLHGRSTTHPRRRSLRKTHRESSSRPAAGRGWGLSRLPG